MVYSRRHFNLLLSSTLLKRHRTLVLMNGNPAGLVDLVWFIRGDILIYCSGSYFWSFLFLMTGKLAVWLLFVVNCGTGVL